MTLLALQDTFPGMLPMPNHFCLCVTSKQCIKLMSQYVKIQSYSLHSMPNKATVEQILLSLVQCAPNIEPMTATPGQLWPTGQPTGSVVTSNQ